MARVQLIAESFEEFVQGTDTNEEASPLNEGLRNSVVKFIKEPKKYEEKLLK